MNFVVEVDYTPNIYLSDLANFIAKKLNKDFIDCTFTLRRYSDFCLIYSIPCLEEVINDNDCYYYDNEIFKTIIDGILEKELPEKFRGIIDI